MFLKPFSSQSIETSRQKQQADQIHPALSQSSFKIQIEEAFASFLKQPTALQKNQYLHQLLDENEVLFYQLVQKEFKVILPILYTPTVGKVVQTFNETRLSTRGLYISWEDRDRIEQILAPYQDGVISIAVLTDGERILGLGDQGVGGIEICIAKAMMYVLCGRIAPYRLLPIYLDVGTNNTALLNDPQYKGLRQQRITSSDYYNFIDKVVTALHKKFPGIYFHWEDISRDHAKFILERYRTTYRMFNDDMQGTGVVTLASALNAMRITQVPLTEQRIIIAGGGTAGIGIADQLCDAMQRMGLEKEQAVNNLWLMGRHGLLFSDSKSLTALQRAYARPATERVHYKTENVALAAAVQQIKPTCLIGCSGQANLFTEEVVTMMGMHNQRPIIFPLSNPTEYTEATPQDILRWTNNKALIATGSPFEPVVVDGVLHTVSQCNNALAFPGIGLGIQASQATLLTDDMLWKACQALCDATQVTRADAALLPDMADIQAVSDAIAVQVACMEPHIIDSQEITKQIARQRWISLERGT